MNTDPNNDIENIQFLEWVKLREMTKDEFGERLCYCGHTFKCTCANPDKATFKESVKRRTIIIGDENNGWKDTDDATTSKQDYNESE